MASNSERLVPLDDETRPLAVDIEPKAEAEHLQELLHTFWQGNYDDDVVKEICVNLRTIETAVCKKYEQLPKVKRDGSLIFT